MTIFLFFFLEIDFWIGNKFFTEKVIRKISFYINNHTFMFMYGWMSHWMNVTEWGGVRECDRTLENWNYLNIHRKVTRFRHRPPPPPNKTKTNFFSNNPIPPPLEKFNDRCNVVLQYLNHHQQTKNSNSLELVYMHVYSKQLSYHLCIKNLFKFLYSVVHIWWGNCKLLCFHKKMNISPTQSKK